MSDDKFLAAERDRLAAMRDELRVQIHLAAAELRDRYEEAERSWHRLEGRAAVVSDTAKEEAKDVREAARLLLSEIREGYEHIKARL